MYFLSISLFSLYVDIIIIFLSSSDLIFGSLVHVNRLYLNKTGYGTLLERKTRCLLNSIFLGFKITERERKYKNNFILPHVYHFYLTSKVIIK